ncbi:MAG: hypothetical protein AAGA23_23655 [Pseudomonadota bacterium]
MTSQAKRVENTRSQLIWLAALAGVMLITRGSLLEGLVPVQLHDASWAVFLLAGAILRKPRFLAALALLALSLDLLALCGDGGSLGACMRPSYLVLMASWLLLFGAGYLMQTSTKAASLARNLALAGAAVTLAYGLTSGGFYLWSGLYSDWTFAEFWNMSAPHFLMALGTSLAYTLAGLLVWAMASRSRSDVTASA